MSRNPFRKARDSQEEVIAAEGAVASGIFELKIPATEQPSTAKSTKKKRVVIKTPPRSPEEPHRRLSLGRPPSPVPRLQTDAFGSHEDIQDPYSATDFKLEEAVINARRNSAETASSEEPAPLTVASTVRAPYNPFARTLATTEDRYGTQERTDNADTTARSKPAFDVDMFKDILMNGATPPARTQAQAEQETTPHNAQESFEAKFPSLETPLPSYSAPTELIEDETSSDEDIPPSRQTQQSDITRTQAGPQIVSFDELKTAPPVLETLAIRNATTNPLPVSPETWPTNQVLRTEDSTSKSTGPTPPPPPARRQAHSSTTSSRRRSSSVMSKSSMQSDASSIAPPASDSTGRVPPPPPARRSRPASEAEPIPSPSSEKFSMAPPPAPAPRRAPTKAAVSDKRSPSNQSRHSLQPLTEVSTSNVVPPRPPPRRTNDSNRSSVDGSLPLRRTSGQDSRRVSHEMEAAVPVQGAHETRADLLSDLAALQREVDELRAKTAAR